MKEISLWSWITGNGGQAALVGGGLSAVRSTQAALSVASRRQSGTLGQGKHWRAGWDFVLVFKTSFHPCLTGNCCPPKAWLLCPQHSCLGKDITNQVDTTGWLGINYGSKGETESKFVTWVESSEDTISTILLVWITFQPVNERHYTLVTLCWYYSLSARRGCCLCNLLIQAVSADQYHSQGGMASWLCCQASKRSWSEESYNTKLGQN